MELPATQTEIEIRVKEKELAELRARKAQEDELRATVTPFDYHLAVGIHEAVCPHPHPSPDCTWFTSNSPDDPERADWTEAQHGRWLGMARVCRGVYDRLKAKGL